MRVNIVTSGRFHVLDLARELSALGHDVRFYSCLPRRRTTRFGLPERCHRVALSWLIPLFALATRAPRPLASLAEKLLIPLADRTAAMLMARCDVFIGMSGLCVVSAGAARRRGAKVFLERGSRHVLSQKAILESIPGHRAPAIPSGAVAREMRGYEMADVIVVPSRHVEQSFIDAGISADRLFRNPYGVDLQKFQPGPRAGNSPPVVIFAGTWSVRKGCDLLWRACENARSWKLIHVGPIHDAVFPASPFVEHVDPVPQWDLPHYLQRADILVLPSREDGFGLVLVQALSCGLPIVCSDRTGGIDLQAMLCEPKWVTIVPAEDLEALSDGIDKAISAAREARDTPDLLGPARDRFSWSRYGERYAAELERRCSR